MFRSVGEMLKWTRSGNTPSLEDIKMAINQDEKDLLRQYQEELVMDGEPNLKCFNAKMMQELDSAFVNTYTENMGKKSLVVYNTFLGRGEDSLNVWNGYIESVVEILQRHESMEGSDLPAGFTARVALSLCWTRDGHPFPILTSSVIDVYNHLLTSISLSIKEVCSFQ